jgi:FAD/FMN-containing dehydrogenase
MLSCVSGRYVAFDKESVAPKCLCQTLWVEAEDERFTAASHGQARRHTLEDSAFPVRNMPYCLGMYTAWPAAGDDNVHLDWLHSFIQAIDPFAGGTGPIGLSNAVGEEAVRAAYRGQYPRLQQMKSTYDPGNLFCHSYNIPPQA